MTSLHPQHVRALRATGAMPAWRGAKPALQRAMVARAMGTDLAPAIDSGVAYLKSLRGTGDATDAADATASLGWTAVAVAVSVAVSVAVGFLAGRLPYARASYTGPSRYTHRGDALDMIRMGEDEARMYFEAFGEATRDWRDCQAALEKAQAT